MEEIKDKEIAISGINFEYKNDKVPTLRKYEGKLGMYNFNKIRKFYIATVKEALKENNIKIKNVLEVGCGVLSNARFIKEILRANYYGFDYSLSRMQWEE